MYWRWYSDFDIVELFSAMTWNPHIYSDSVIFPESYDFKGEFEIFGGPLSPFCDPSDLLLHRGMEVSPSSETFSYGNSLACGKL